MILDALKDAALLLLGGAVLAGAWWLATAYLFSL